MKLRGEHIYEHIPLEKLIKDKSEINIDDPENMLMNSRNELLQLKIETANICDLKCPYCRTTATKIKNNSCLKESKTVINPEKFQRILTDAISLGLKTISFEGKGEPFYDPYFQKYLELAFKKELFVKIHTNFILLDEYLLNKENPTRFKNVFDLIFSSTNTRYVSFITTLFNEKLNNQNHWKFRSLENLVKLGFSNKKETQLCARILVHKKNIKSIKGYVEYCLSRNIFPKIQSIYKIGRASDKYSVLSEKEFEELYNEINELIAHDFSNIIETTDFFGYPSNSIYYSATIDTEGRVKLLPELENDFVFGNINKSSLKKIWLQNREWKSIRHLDSFIEGKCSNCSELKKGCYGDRVLSFLNSKNGNIYGENTFCLREVKKRPISLSEQVITKINQEMCTKSYNNVLVVGVINDWSKAKNIHREYYLTYILPEVLYDAINKTKDYEMLINYLYAKIVYNFGVPDSFATELMKNKKIVMERYKWMNEGNVTDTDRKLFGELRLDIENSENSTRKLMSVVHFTQENKIPVFGMGFVTFPAEDSVYKDIEEFLRGKISEYSEKLYSAVIRDYYNTIFNYLYDNLKEIENEKQIKDKINEYFEYGLKLTHTNISDEYRDKFENSDVDYFLSDKREWNIHLVNYIINLIQLRIQVLKNWNELLNAKEKTLRIAIISILIDSFSHNISAHSLNAIVWLFQKRAEELNYRYLKLDSKQAPQIISKKNVKKNRNDTFIFIDENERNAFVQKAVENFIKLGRSRGQYEDTFSLQDIISNMNYVVKDKLFDYEDLQYDKNNIEGRRNPTIPVPLENEITNFLKYLNEKSAFWNGVTRDIPSGGLITDWFEILYQFANNPLFLGTIAFSEKKRKFRLKIGLNKSKPKEFVSIDINPLFLENKDIVRDTFSNNYIHLSEDFTELRKTLKSTNMKLFLPAGVIGKQALYTIFENTIRNIKHTNSNGDEIVFCINIEDTDTKLFKSSIWLENISTITDDTKTKVEESLKNSILTHDGKPRLGGTSQDKLCAAMLFNNYFSLVETEKYYILSKAKKDDRHRKPWMYIDTKESGIIKRTFYLWKGEIVSKLGKDYVSSLSGKNEIKDNPSRFMFSIMPSTYNIPSWVISELGLVRCLQKNKSIEKIKNIDSLYAIWNKKWLMNVGEYYVGDESNAFQKIYCNGETWTINKLDHAIKYPVNTHHIKFAHGEVSNNNEVLQYRNHGPFKEYFFRNGITGPVDISDGKPGMFIESLLTTVDIYDNRIYDRVSSYNKVKLYSDFIQMNVHQESNIGFNKNYDFYSKTNIVIIHLSFIESLNYKEKNIKDFIIDYFENYLADNRKLIITTGRGRGLWWDCLKEKSGYDLNRKIEHILFKPIDSILSAVQDGLIMKDDFVTKYNLMKVIFGS